MPSRQPLWPAPQPLILPTESTAPIPPPNNETLQHQYHHLPGHSLVIIPPITGTAVSLSFLMCLTMLYRKLLPRKRTTPSDSNTPHRFSYSVLRRATSSFSTSNHIGRGGFGSVYRGTLSSGQEIAVKVMDSGTLQGEREFHNEVSLAGGKIDSDKIVSLIGYSSDRKKHGRRMLLVYELMQNGSLQDALIHRKCTELMVWKKRLEIIIDIARGLEYLHSSCNPPIIHGDVKPSNILLDSNFNAKIADFGLARLKNEDHCELQVEVVEIDGEKKVELEGNKDNTNFNGETESVASSFGEDTTPKKGLIGGVRRSLSERNWWWRQSSGRCSESGSVKDYVMEWIAAEIKMKPTSVTEEDSRLSGTLEGKKQKRSLDWWMANDDEEEEAISNKDKSRKARKWWREEFCEELRSKNKNKNKMKKKNKWRSGSVGRDRWCLSDGDSIPETKKKNKKSGSRNSWSSIDWWLEGLSGELWTGRHSSHDGGNETPRSSGVSSTTSMRGTVCYIAPEYGSGEQVSEKCDVYSYGVLLLVLISGRRPLQVTVSPLREFERANLISWARNLARKNKLLDLVDSAIQSLDRDQALLCITVALLCLQKSSAKRPTMKEVVAMLSGESEPPHLPLEFSPSPPLKFPHKSRRKAQ